MKKQFILPMVIISLFSISCIKAPPEDSQQEIDVPEVVETEDENDDEQSEEAHLELVMSGNSSNGLEEIYINIDHVELLMENSDEEMMDMAYNVGQVNIAEYQNGSSLYLDDDSFNAGSKIKGFKLILSDYDHYVIKDNGDYCDLVFAKGFEEKLHLILKDIELEKGLNYRLNIDFLSSIVFKDNGVCLINPSLELESFESVEEELCDDDWDEEDEDFFWDEE